MAHLWFLLPWTLIFELSEFPQRIYHDVKEVEHALPLNTFPGEVLLVAVESAKMWSKPEGTTVDTSAGFVIRNYLASWFMTHLYTGRKQIKLPIQGWNNPCTSSTRIGHPSNMSPFWSFATPSPRNGLKKNDHQPAFCDVFCETFWKSKPWRRPRFLVESLETRIFWAILDAENVGFQTPWVWRKNLDPKNPTKKAFSD